MQTARDIASNAFQIARFATHATIWASNSTSRYLTSGYRGVCLVCNNLQPYGHEDTFGSTRAPWHDSTRSPLSDEVARDLASAPSLYIPDIPTQEILESRDVDPKTGRPINDCPYCRLLCDIFDAFFADRWMNWVTETRNGMGLTVGLMIREGRPLVVNCVRFTYEVPVVMYPRVDVEVYIDHALEANLPGAPCVGVGGRRALDNRDEQSAIFLFDCVKQCVEEHPECNGPSAVFNPTRLLDIGGPNDVLRLYETKETGPQLQYAALSHCWGGSQPIKLLTANQDAFKSSIPHSNLPPTFRDAIAVSRELSIRYLWIDSLCIIQNDALDWEREAAQMGQVYSSAFLVISAASSANAETHFLGPRDKSMLPKSFPFAPPSSNTTIPLLARRRHLKAVPMEQGLHEPPFTSPWASLKRPDPLFTRAWCFQESHLATRILHFTTASTLFECRTHRRSEDALPPYPLLSRGPLPLVPDDLQWRMLVKSYTSRQLTFPSDKLVALSGIAAKSPQASHGARYLAGLWDESLLLDLLWQPMPGASKDPLAYASTEQAAPSWSWASVDRGVTYDALHDVTLLAEVLSVETNVSGVNPYGSVLGGAIVLRARLRRCKIAWKAELNQHRAYLVGENGARSAEQHFISDGLLISQSDGSRFAKRGHKGGRWGDDQDLDAAFVCIAKTPWVHMNFMGLLVAPSQQVEGVWERVANITKVTKEWFESGVEQEVTLV
ncbi:hypothetical protein TI39_contig397g00015 [Zymoseptoria brevis]|uniref:Heterokaryon incompatibility domain-containing protein n=1 Tax=Zymoseptoria brevis TaxID=1047168 RepID=A0A0F4GNP4_9PEZI|nr:hypothetical protein TI39_contig397g00015 [Zymoseptoria brevis]